MTLVETYLNLISDFKTKLDGPLSYPEWIRELSLKIKSETPIDFQEFYKKGNEYLESIEKEEREKQKREFDLLFHFIVSKSLASDGLNLEVLTTRDGLFATHVESMLQNLQERASAMVRLKPIARDSSEIFYEKLLLQNFTFLERFLVDVTIFNDLEIEQVLKALRFIVAVHAELKEVWDLDLFFETYRFTSKLTDLLSGPIKKYIGPFLRNTETEYWNLVDYVHEKGWEVPSNHHDNKKQSPKGFASKTKHFTSSFFRNFNC